MDGACLQAQLDALRSEQAELVDRYSVLEFKPFEPSCRQLIGRAQPFFDQLETVAKEVEGEIAAGCNAANAIASMFGPWHPSLNQWLNFLTEAICGAYRIPPHLLEPELNAAAKRRSDVAELARSGWEPGADERLQEDHQTRRNLEDDESAMLKHCDPRGRANLYRGLRSEGWSVDKLHAVRRADPDRRRTNEEARLAIRFALLRDAYGLTDDAAAEVLGL